ncbi:MAG: efflux RND transporter permease subunit [Planctomycetia bacterium]|nr:efflux RND transporter permease subunit [Planctomycetia bacterium]
MLNWIIAASLKNRLLVLAATLVLVLYGAFQAAQLPIDVFPDLNRPTVTIMTESHGLAPEEVETLVTLPIESAMNGASHVLRVRSASGIGISIVWVEFAWGTDIYVDRQIVAEKLQLVRERLPKDTNPVITPISSIMGEIMLVGLQATGETTPIDLRTIADWTIRRRLLAIGGVSQVTVLGGEIKQYQVLTSPSRLAHYDVTLDELVRAVGKANVASGGGFLMEPNREALIRIVGRAATLEDIENTVVHVGDTLPVTVRQVADVRFAGPVKRGTGSVGGEPAVILVIQKQPGADTLTLDERIDETLDDMAATLPADVRIQRDIFRQSSFIRVAIGNVQEAIRDGALWVVVILFVFLWNLRTSLITLTAIPLAIIITALVFRYMGVTINTMTLGGLAVAIGELVDDSIVDVENIYRRLKENRHKPRPEHPLRVIYLASSEVRNSIVYATLIVVLVVFPLFSLPGLEGRLFAPLGLSYVVTLLASLVVSLTVTPALASYLLPGAKFLDEPHDPFVLRWLKRFDERLLRFSLRHATAVLSVVALLVVAAFSSIFGMGGEFLPPFNEGSLTIAAAAPASTSLEESNRMGTLIEKSLLAVPEVTHVSRRTGRAELDEHAENVNFSEIDVGLVDPLRPRPGVFYAILRAIPGLHRLGLERVGRPREEVLEDIRDRLSSTPGVKSNVGQPIAHRLDHMMSGISAQVAVKLFGADLGVLRAEAERIHDLMAAVPGIVDLAVEPQVEIPQVRVTVLRDEAIRYGLSPADVAQSLETALQGTTVSQVLDGQRTFDLVVWFDETARNDIELIRQTLISTPSGARVALGSVAEVLETTGPNTINRENVVRRIVVQANVAGRDLESVVADVRRAVTDKVLPELPPGYFIEYGGQFEAQQQANVRLLALGSLSLAGIFLLLVTGLGSWRAALQVMVNIPLAAIGSVLALVLINWPTAEALQAAPFWEWPRVWVEATSLSVAHWVGFITLVGIVCRNGIMMISHYVHLMRFEGEKFDEHMIVRGSLERLAPVLMTALTAIIGLVPLALGAGQTGKEILHPLAVVVIGGLLSSTLLDQIVTPALFFKFGRKVYEHRFDHPDEEASEAELFAPPEVHPRVPAGA